jgi:hypothetical protein
MAQDSGASGLGPSYTGDGTSGFAAFGAQAETAGVGVTSYIPTAGSTVTRSQDILSLPLTSLPGWNASKGGVLVAAYRLHTLKSVQTLINIADSGAGTNAIILYDNFSGAARGTTVVASANVPISGAAPPSVFVRRKMAFGWTGGHDQIAHDGTLDNTNGGQASLPTSLVTAYIGTNQGGGLELNGTIESLAYYAGARPDAFIQVVSR